MQLFNIFKHHFLIYQLELHYTKYPSLWYQRHTLRFETSSGNWKSFKNDENCFLSHPKSSFRSWDISFFCFWEVSEWFWRKILLMLYSTWILGLLYIHATQPLHVYKKLFCAIFNQRKTKGPYFSLTPCHGIINISNSIKSEQEPNQDPSQ